MQVLGLDVWNGSATQLSLYRESTDVRFPLLMKASKAIGLSAKGAIDAIWVVDRAGILQFMSPRNRPEIDQAINTIDALLENGSGAEAGDFDQDGQVGFQDFLMFAEAYGSTAASFDLDQNGRVDFPDFLMFARTYSTR